MPTYSTNATNLLLDLISMASKAGADAADAILVDTNSLSVGCRLGKIESLEGAESGDLGLRVFIGKQQAIVSATDRRTQTLQQTVDRAIAMAKAAPEDDFCGLADSDMVTTNWPQLDSADDVEFTSDSLIASAREAEEAALAVRGVTNSEGAEVGATRAKVTLVASNGFLGQYCRTSYSLSAAIIAGDGVQMERDYDFASRVFAADLPLPASIGKKAGERAVKRLGSRKMPTGQWPVVLEPRIAGSILGALSSAISGANVARGTSFLKDALGNTIFSPSITITEDPFRARGLRSRPFDAEGLLPQKRTIIDKGVLTTWLLDLRSARQLRMKSTGHASRSPGGTPSPSISNAYIEAGTLSSTELIKDIKEGFYVTELMGMGINGVTGDYSQAASGFWIENGVISFPVSEMTIAGNLKNMFKHLTAANDLEFLRGIDSPTLRIEGMTVAGI
jgi:PmbA protein